MPQSPTLEERVAALEKAVARITAPPPPPPTQFKDWRRAVEMFPGNELTRQIDEAGREIRETDRRDAGT